MPTLHQTVLLAVIGLAAGSLGGLLGIGGSVIMIPGMTLVLKADQHLAQAAAMIVGIFISIPAAFRHHLAKAVRFDAMLRILPVAIVAILVGVELSNLMPGEDLKKLFGVFLIYVVATTAWRTVQRRAEPTAEHERLSWPRCAIVGAITGLAAGMLGIGGGIIFVPLTQRICRLPLRQVIATSSALMSITAIFGAVLKNITLVQHTNAQGQTLDVKASLIYAALLVPTAIVGSYLGAGLTHKLPITWVRVAFMLLILWSAFKLLGIV